MIDRAFNAGVLAVDSAWTRHLARRSAVVAGFASRLRKRKAGALRIIAGPAFADTRIDRFLPMEACARLAAEGRPGVHQTVRRIYARCEVHHNACSVKTASFLRHATRFSGAGRGIRRREEIRPAVFFPGGYQAEAGCGDHEAEPRVA